MFDELVEDLIAGSNLGRVDYATEEAVRGELLVEVERAGADPLPDARQPLAGCLQILGSGRTPYRRPIPNAVVCLISALAYHELTTQVPRAVQLAVPRGKYAALRLRSPPVVVYRFDSATFEEGVESHRLDVAVEGTAQNLPSRTYG